MSNLFNSFREIKEKSLGVWFITVNTANITVFCPWRASFCCFSLSLAPNKERCIMRVPKNEIKLQQCLSPPCSVELLCPLCSTKVYSPFHDKQSSQFYNLTLRVYCGGKGVESELMDFLPVFWKSLETSKNGSIFLSTAIKFLQTFNNVWENINLKININDI